MTDTGFFSSTELRGFFDRIMSVKDLSDWCEPVKISDDLWRCRMGDDGEVNLPDEIMERLGWEAGDTLSIETTEVWDEDGERMGILLTKVSPNSDESEPEVAS